MPSIPQSLLWISLVVLWLFVLVPMLISKRDAVRRTSDVALATRVLNSAAGVRLLKRGGPAAGHRSDPDWQPEEDDYDDLGEAHTEDLTEALADVEPSRSVVTMTAAAETAGPDYLDVDVIDENSAALPAGEGAADEYQTEDLEDQDDLAGGDYEYVEDTSGLAAEADPATTVTPGSFAGASRRRRYDSRTAEAVSARKYRFRKRTLSVMTLAVAASTLAAFTVAPGALWLCGATAGITVCYLAYLRRQTRIEQRVRRRRMQRMARARVGVENTADHEYDLVPARLHQPGTAVLEIDDEDPAFEHLDYEPYARHYHWSRDLPRAAGQ